VRGLMKKDIPDKFFLHSYDNITGNSLQIFSNKGFGQYLKMFSVAFKKIWCASKARVNLPHIGNG
jgi:hypothetical protein